VGQVLIYHPAYDAYHCTIRMAALLTKVKELDVEKARILDFYLAFPGAAATLRLPLEMASARRTFQTMKNIYRDPVSAKRTFTDIRQVQLAALGCLAAGGIIDHDKLQAGTVVRTNKPLPKAIEQAVIGYVKEEDEVLNILTQEIATIPTAGPQGLKDRSELLEYRYDFV
jgi:hypothetical protein